ncbi:MAG TPA: hypothetical protein VJB05_03665, partial [archaeon]|nr:hypothetical protein [archaeon]
MRKIVLVFALLLLLSCTAYSQKQIEGKPCIYFFYGNGCPHCAAVELFIGQLGEKYNIEVKYFESYDNRSNMVLLNNYFDKYNVTQDNRGVPAVFTMNSYYIGDTPILEDLEKNISQLPAGCPSLNMEEFSGSIPMFTLIGAALVDSINPCAIAVLLILLGALLASGDRKRALKTGIAFIASIYIAYFLFGLGLFSALQISGISLWFYSTVGILAIIIGIANIKDYFWYGKGGFVMEVPRSWRPTLKALLSKATTPLGAFIMGFAICLFELPCTGGPYIFILGLLAQTTTQAAAIPLLIIYNFFFILPLLI